MKVQDKKSFILYIIIIIVSAFFLNNISREFPYRLDLTDTKMFTLSESTITVVEKVDDLLTMQVFFSEDLPNELGNNKRFLQDLLEEYRAAQKNHNIEFEFFNPSDQEIFESEAQKYGIQPVQVNVIENDKLEIKKVHIGMVILYNDDMQTIPVIQTTTGLEYTITSMIKKLVDTEKSTIGIFSLEAEKQQTQGISELLRQTYDVLPISLDNEVANNIDVMMMTGIEDSLPEQQLNNLNNFLKRGGNLFIAQNRLKTDIQTQQADPIQSNIFSLLATYGINIKENLVLDRQCGQVTVSQNRGFFRMNSAVDYPFFPRIRTFSDSQPIVGGLEEVQVLFPSEVEQDSLAINTFTPLFTTSESSTVMEQFYNLYPIDNPAFNNLNEGPFAVAGLFGNNDDSTNINPEIIVVGDTKFLSDDGGGRIPENLTFVLNAIDYLTGDSDLIALRSREITTRPLNELAADDSVKNSWKFINYFLPSLLVLIMGIIKLGIESGRSKKLELEFE